MKVSAETKFNTSNLESFLKRASRSDIFSALERYGQEGVDALSAATPVDSGLSASKWYYTIKRDKTSWSIIWGNHNVVDGTPVVILLQYGHGTGTGGYVKGKDFINPALKPIFDRIGRDIRKVVYQR